MGSIGSHKLVEIVFYISLIVVILLAISFTILFTLYSVYKRKNIKNGHEDASILNDLKRRYHLNDDSKKDVSLVECIKKGDKRRKVFNTIGNTISYFTFIAILVFGVFILSYKLEGDNFYFGNTTYLVIQTSSMEKAYEGNTYLKENNLTNQIIQFSMIGVDKVEAKDIKLYDVIAFTNTDGDTIVHRVVRISNDKGEYSFTFRGDSNSISGASETNIKYDKIIGRYNGFQNYGLGVSTTYFKSSSGILALASAFVFLICFDITEALIEKDYKNRQEYLAKEYDSNK